MPSKKDRPADNDVKREGKPFNMHKEHWEVRYHESPPNDRKNLLMGSQFNPLNTKNRVKTYNPVTETDS